MKKVIYTCITGQYDDACAHVFVDDTWEYVMFTDNQYLLGLGRYMHWGIRPLMFDKMTNVKNARWHKINANLLFPEYQYSLWIDGNIVIMEKDFFIRINNFIDNSEKICIPPHPVRNCIYDEADVIKQKHIDNKNTVNQQIRLLKFMRYPCRAGLNETCIILRKHNDRQIIRLQRKWWRMVRKYSKRDQLSYNWAAWRCKIKTTPMFSTPGEHRRCKELLFVHTRRHNQCPCENPDSWVGPRWVVRTMAIGIRNRKKRRKFIQRHSR